MADGQSEACPMARTVAETVENVLHACRTDATARVADGYYKFIAGVVVADDHLATVGEMYGIAHQMVDDRAKVLHVDIDHQPLIGIVSPATDF